MTELSILNEVRDVKHVFGTEQFSSVFEKAITKFGLIEFIEYNLKFETDIYVTRFLLEISSHIKSLNISEWEIIFSRCADSKTALHSLLIFFGFYLEVDIKQFFINKKTSIVASIIDREYVSPYKDLNSFFNSQKIIYDDLIEIKNKFTSNGYKDIVRSNKDIISLNDFIFDEKTQCYVKKT